MRIRQMSQFVQGTAAAAGYTVLAGKRRNRSAGWTHSRSPGGHAVGEHVRRAHEALRGEHQLAEYVAGLEIEDCARILAESKTGLPALAARRDECRVGPDDRRSFEEVIRVWTLEVLSGIEG
jgi:hypothetical protein